MEPLIAFEHVSKQFRNGTQALEDVSFSVSGGVYGLLGHNGAGKTTLMRALATVLAPSCGSIRLCGFDTVKQRDQVRARIGYLPQELAMYPSLSVFDFVSYMAALKGIRGRRPVEAALEQVGMLEHARRKTGGLSGGMKRRVGIAQALVGEPPVLVVDEPTAGLDPEERVRFRGVLSQYARQGRAVLLSTHIVEDLHQICGELAVLRRGRLFFAGSSAALMKQVEGKVKLLSLEQDSQLLQVQRQAVVLAAVYESHGLTARIMDEQGLFPGAAPVPATLEDAYVYCMGGKHHE